MPTLHSNNPVPSNGSVATVIRGVKSISMTLSGVGAIRAVVQIMSHEDGAAPGPIGSQIVVSGTTTVTTTQTFDAEAGEVYLQLIDITPACKFSATLTELGPIQDTNPGSPTSPFATTAERTAWATANLAALLPGRTTVWGPGGEWVWNGPLATDWIAAPKVDVLKYKTKVVRDRVETIPDLFNNIGTLFLTKSAPGRFVAVRLIVGGSVADASRTFSFSFAPSAAYGNGYTATNAAGQPIVRTAITWGGFAYPNNFRNKGGGANTTILNTASGSAASKNLLQNVAVSDWLFIRSIDRVDFPTRRPLYTVRMYGDQMPGYLDQGRFDPTQPNPRHVIDPDFFSGHIITENCTVNEPSVAPTQRWCPNIDVEFLMMDGEVTSYAVAGDSLEHGYCPGIAVPLWGGGSNAWPRKLETALRAEGKSVNCCSFAQGGQESNTFNEMLYDALMLSPPGFKFAFFKPYSVNSNGDVSISVVTHLARCDRLISKCEEVGVAPIIIQPWAGQNGDAGRAAAVKAYCDNLKSSGVLVFDPNLEIATAEAPNVILPQYLNRDSGGNVIDTIHLNEAGQDKIAAFALQKVKEWGFI